MTIKTNARLAGFAFLFYIVIGITSMVLSNQATRGAEGFAAKLASIAQHATTMRLAVLLTLGCFLSAVVLGVTLYALTRDEDRDLAMLALLCRVTEGVTAVAGAVATMQLIAIATASTTAPGMDATAVNAAGALMLTEGGWTGNISAICFVIGSTIFSYLFVRARSIPSPLAWLGVVASVLLLIALPAGLVADFSVPFLVWVPMLVFEVTLAFWLLIKGVASSRNDEHR
jgi:Domain of unknown function (DUF4386)